MDESLPLNFLHRFNGVIWSTLASADEGILLVEVRNLQEKQVSFSALNVAKNQFLWRDKKLEEPWWVNATAIRGNRIIFTIYLDTNNPDKKGILAYDAENLGLIWWNNDFSVAEINGNQIVGFSSKLGLRQVALNLETGKEEPKEMASSTSANNVQRPVQYPEGMDHFVTVKTFLADRLNLVAVSALEYLEAGENIIISCYVNESDGLANYLLVLSSEGKLLMKEKIDSSVKGIGLDTFFIFNGSLIFVRNKSELVSYKIL